MKKILLVGNTSWSMVKFRLGIIKKLIRLNYKVYILSPLDKHSIELTNLGCTFINVKIDNKGSNPYNDIKLINNLRKIYLTINPDLIIHYTIKPNIYGSIAAKLANKKSVAVVTGLGFTFINDTLVSKIAKVLYKFSFRFSNKVFFINKDDKNEFLNNKLVDKEKVILLPGEGINTELFKKDININKDNKFRFLLIARMLWDKGVGEYVEAAKLLKTKYENVEFGLLGYLDVNNPMAITREQMNIWEKEGNITFFGSTDDVRRYITQSDCIVLPSYREGISMTLMESASMEKPLIAANVPGCKDLIDDNVSGYLCKVKSSIDLSNKMEKMLSLSNKERISMGLLGREKMLNEFDEKIVINKYLDLIEEII